MRRELSPARPDWRARVEEAGLTYHTAADGTAYWREDACYVLDADEVDAIEAATAELHRLCLAAVDHVVRHDRFAALGFPAAAVPLVRASWAAQPPSLYGRFDLCCQPGQPPKLLEYNADTPTSLVEAAVAQWHWLEQVHPGGDQFNSIHERLVEAWRVAGRRVGTLAEPRPLVHLCSGADEEDVATTAYVRDAADEAGLATEQLLVEEIGWDAARGRFVDLAGRPIATAFKLYPWEWMAGEAFAANLAVAAPYTTWIEPAWKLVCSHKGILALLWELFPDHPNLLPAYRDEWRLEAYARKPLLAREGANVALVMFGETLAEERGDYGEEGYVYQALAPLPRFDGHSAVVGSWVVGGEPAGVGIRESDGPITTNRSRFVPHRIG